MNKKQILKELATRQLEENHQAERGDLIEYIKTYFRNEKPKGIKEFHVSPFHLVISDILQKALDGEYTRIIINIPPGHGKTELITKSFPVWAMGKNPHLQVIATGYSTTLTQGFSSEAKDYYKSDTFRSVFPRSGAVKKSQDTKEHRQTDDGGSYYATGFDGSITGKRANLFIIDDPIKPNEANKSDVVRTGVNNLFANTVPSRLFNPAKDIIIVIMQRTHDNDLCGFLIDRMNRGGEKRKVLSMPAIAEEDEEFDTKYGTIQRKQGEVLDDFRFPVSTLEMLKSGTQTEEGGLTVWSTQYQQQPVNKETQEFHEEWFLYHGTDTNPTPQGLRIFTAVDPAFKQGQENDQSSIITVGFKGDTAYILEYSAGRYTSDVLQDKITYHIKKWSPEKVGIEAFQAQSMILTFLKSHLQSQSIYVNLEEIRQTGDKLSKIRKLTPLYRNGQIYHRYGMEDLESQLIKFPRAKHDDIIDSLQMVYDLYTLQPNTERVREIRTSYDEYGRPVYS